MRRHDERVALEVMRRSAMQRDQFGHRHRRARGIGGEGRLAPPFPGRHDEKGERADAQRHEAALPEFQRARDEKGAVHRRQRAPDEAGGDRAPSPIAPRDREHRDRGDQHHARDRQSIGGGERGGGAEADHQRDAAEIERPVDEGHIDLPGMGVMRVPDVEPRKQAEPDRLRGQRERAGYERLRGDDRRGGGEHDKRQNERGRRQAVEQLSADRLRAA